MALAPAPVKTAWIAQGDGATADLVAVLGPPGRKGDSGDLHPDMPVILASAEAARDDAVAAAADAATARDAADGAAGAAAGDAANAAASATTVAALLQAFRGVFLGAFADDGAAEAFAAGQGIALADGLMYEHTGADKFRIYDGAAWGDYDATAQASQSAAALSAAAAAGSAADAQTARDAAVASADTASADAALAATCAASAEASAVSASAQADQASAKATEASDAAAAAAASAASADGDATAAAASALAASADAADASAAAVAAANSATAADASADAAAASAAAVAGALASVLLRDGSNAATGDFTFTKGAFAMLGTSDAFGLGFKTAGVERARIDETGRFGIGQNAPAARLHVTDTTGAGSGALAASALVVEQTWNTTGAPSAFVVNATNNASSANSLLADFRVGGSSKVKIGASSWIGLNAGCAIGASGSWTIFYNSVSPGGFAVGISTTGVISLTPGGSLEWGTYATGPATLGLYNPATDILAQYRGTNPQASRIHGTRADPSNGRWLELAMTSAGVASLKATGNGTGASGNVLHISSLPTSNPGPGILWNNAGTPAIGT